MAGRFQVVVIMERFLQGCFEGRHYALFQCKVVRVSDAQNLIDLTAEIRLLATGQYFADSFAERAKIENVVVPCKSSPI
jgi:hypothetical protein